MSDDKLNIILEKLNTLEYNIRYYPKRTKASLLIQEYLNNEDLDDNNIIYGYDFEILYDNDIPEILLEFQQKFKNKTLKKISWKEFKNERSSQIK